MKLHKMTCYFYIIRRSFRPRQNSIRKNEKSWRNQSPLPPIHVVYNLPCCTFFILLVTDGANKKYKTWWSKLSTRSTSIMVFVLLCNTTVASVQWLADVGASAFLSCAGMFGKKSEGGNEHDFAHNFHKIGEKQPPSLTGKVEKYAVDCGMG